MLHKINSSFSYTTKHTHGHTPYTIFKSYHTPIQPARMQLQHGIINFHFTSQNSYRRQPTKMLYNFSPPYATKTAPTHGQHPTTRLQQHINISMNFISFYTLQQQLKHTTQHSHMHGHIQPHHNFMNFIYLHTPQHPQIMHNTYKIKLNHTFPSSFSHGQLALSSKRIVFLSPQLFHDDEGLLISKKARKKINPS